MLIAQMTDIHIGFAPDEKPEELNRLRFRATLARMLEGPNRPDMLVLSGDITDHGDRESYEHAAELLAALPVPGLADVSATTTSARHCCTPSRKCAPTTASCSTWSSRTACGSCSARHARGRPPRRRVLRAAPGVARRRGSTKRPTRRR